MEWLFTVLMTGVLLSIGWRVGGLIFEGIYSFVVEAPDGIRRIKRYRNRKHKSISYTNYYYGNRKRS